MSEASLPRLRQVVLAARSLDAAVGDVEDALGVADPFSDPLVEQFGLRNAVFALGDSFVEVLAPRSAGTAAGRYLDGRGEACGYMVILQVADITAARAAMGHAGVREVWCQESDDIREVHLHPTDTDGALLSLAEVCPRESWPPGGPAWTGSADPRGHGRIWAATVGARDPLRTAARWAALAGKGARALGSTLRLGDTTIEFVRAVEPIDVGLREVRATVASGRPRDDHEVAVGTVRFRLEYIDNEEGARTWPTS